MSSVLDRLRAHRFALAPDVLLTPDGPVTDQALVVEGGSIVSVGPRAALSEADARALTVLPGHAVVPGFVDAHTPLTEGPRP